MPKGQGLTKPMKLSADLAEVVGKKEASRAECIKQLWAYIKKNNLQDPENKQYFTPDKKMAKVDKTSTSISLHSCLCLPLTFHDHCLFKALSCDVSYRSGHQESLYTDRLRGRVNNIQPVIAKTLSWRLSLNAFVYNVTLKRAILFQVFGSERIRAFGMAKFLSAHLS